MPFVHLLRIDRLLGTAEKCGVLAKFRRPKHGCTLPRCYPVAAALIMDARNASRARFVPGHPFVDACRPHRLNPEALHHLVHGVGLLQDPLHHRPAVTKIRHGTVASWQAEGRTRARIDLDQLTLRRNRHSARGGPKCRTSAQIRLRGGARAEGQRPRQSWRRQKSRRLPKYAALGLAQRQIRPRS